MEIGVVRVMLRKQVTIQIIMSYIALVSHWKWFITVNTIYLFCYVWSLILESDFVAKCFNLQIQINGNSVFTAYLSRFIIMRSRVQVSLSLQKKSPTDNVWRAFFILDSKSLLSKGQKGKRHYCEQGEQWAFHLYGLPPWLLEPCAASRKTSLSLQKRSGWVQCK